MNPRPHLLLGSVLTIGFVGMALVLSLSDRVGLRFGAVSAAFLALLHELERVAAVDLIDRSDVPFTADALGHAALWGIGMLLIGWFFRRHVPLVALAVSVFALSLAAEVGQRFFSLSRSARIDDAVANFVGIAVAAVAVGAAGRLVDRQQRRRSMSLVR